PGPNGYTTTYSGDCSGSIAAGETKTCTVTNDDLTLNSLTTAGLCKYDMDPARSNAQFKLAFTPDQSNPSTYVLGGSNPGQIAYNVLYQGGTGPTALHLTIPYPWVTVGATPIHVYDSVSFTPDGSGHPKCWLPGNQIATSNSQIVLGDYSPAGFTATKTVDVNYTSSTGFAFVSVKVAYGLVGTNNYVKSSKNNDALDATTKAKRIP